MLDDNFREAGVTEGRFGPKQPATQSDNRPAGRLVEETKWDQTILAPLKTWTSRLKAAISIWSPISSRILDRASKGVSCLA